MTNTQKAILRKIAKKVEEMRQEVEQLQSDLDEYVFENQDRLDGTERGEKLDTEIDELFAVQETFETLNSELLEIAG